MTIDDIAKEAGVSKATVSRVLNDKAEGVGPETRQRIKELIARQGFEPSGPARGLATGRSRSVGLVIPDIADPFFPLLIRGIQDALRERSYGLFLCDSDRDIAKEEAHVRNLLEKRVDGVILNSTLSDCDCQLDLLDKRSVPYVLLDRRIESRVSAAGVYSDNGKGARMATDLLLESQPRQFVFLNGPEELSVCKERWAGVQASFRQRGRDPASILYAAGDYSVESGERVLATLLGPRESAGGRFALFAANDRMAIGAMRTLKRLGYLVPGDVEVVGYDDIEMARLVDPPLTTVAQPAFAMGQAAAQLLLRIIDGKKPRQKTIELEPALVIRGTTRPRT